MRDHHEHDTNTPATDGSAALDLARVILAGEPAAVEREALYTAAVGLLGEGRSVIPVWGDAQPDRAKQPVIAWGAYTTRRASPSELRQWFLEGNAGGLALVCGRISGLVVLEFDDPAPLAAFASACPDLLDTRTITSAGRGLPHFYYQPPPGADYHFRGAAGFVELRGEGQYVLTFPTTITGRAYEVTTPRPVLALSADQWARLLDFMAGFGSRPEADPDPAPVVERAALPVPDTDPAPLDTDAIALIALYERQLTRTGGRNDALYAVACAARDAGWPEHAAADALLVPFVHTAPPAGHALETADARAAEGRATVASAYRRPRRPLATTAAAGLPTAARERLLQAGLVSTARTLDALRLAGWADGREFTEREAVEACAPFGVSRPTVRRALSPAPASVPVSSTRAGASEGTEINLSPFCIVTTPLEHTMYVRVKNDDKLNRGPKAQHYRMPSCADLCAQLGVADQGTDPLQPADLASASAYRKAINRALIRRRPGQYSKAWLAERLGVKARTLSNYTAQDAHVSATAQYHRQDIHRATIQLVPDEPDKTDWGKWLEDGTLKDDGTPRRYPPVRAIAARLLDMGRAVVLVTRERNRYEFTAQPAQDAQQAPQDAPQAQTTSSTTSPAKTPENAPIRDMRASPPPGWDSFTIHNGKG